MFSHLFLVILKAFRLPVGPAVGTAADSLALTPGLRLQPLRCREHSRCPWHSVLRPAIVALDLQDVVTAHFPTRIDTHRY